MSGAEGDSLLFLFVVLILVFMDFFSHVMGLCGRVLFYLCVLFCYFLRFFFGLQTFAPNFEKFLPLEILHLHLAHESLHAH